MDEIFRSIPKEFFIQPDFSSQHMKSLMNRIITQIHPGSVSEDMEDRIRNKIERTYYFLRDMAVQTKLRYEPDFVKKIKKINENREKKLSKQDVFSFNMRNYVTKLMDIQEGIGYNSFWKAVQITKKTLQSNIDGVKENKFYKYLLNKDVTAITDEKNPFYFMKRVKSPLCMESYKEIKEKLVGPKYNELMPYVTKLFFLQMITSMPMIPDPEYMKLLFGEYFSSLTKKDIDAMGYCDFPHQKPFYDILVTSETSKRLTYAMEKCCPGFKDGLNKENWFTEHAPYNAIFEEEDPRALYAILRVYTLYVSMLKDYVEDKDVIDVLTKPFGSFIEVTQGVDKNVYTSTITLNDWIREAIDAIKENPEESDIKRYVSEAYDLFAYAFVSHYAIHGVYSSDILLHMDKSRIRVKSNEAIYTQLEKEFVNRIATEPLTITNEQRTMYIDTKMLQLKIGIPRKESKMYLSLKRPESRNIRSMGVQANINDVESGLDKIVGIRDDVKRRLKQHVTYLKSLSIQSVPITIIMHILMDEIYNSKVSDGLSFKLSDFQSLIQGTTDGNFGSIQDALKATFFLYDQEKKVYDYNPRVDPNQVYVDIVDRSCSMVLVKEFGISPVYHSMYRDVFPPRSFDALPKDYTLQYLIESARLLHNAIVWISRSKLPDIQTTQTISDITKNRKDFNTMVIRSLLDKDIIPTELSQEIMDRYKSIKEEIIQQRKDIKGIVDRMRPTFV